MYCVHIDCNSYFASCEVATRPELDGKPVVVANDVRVIGGAVQANEWGRATSSGVILALNAEAKALGLVRGVPLFKVMPLLKEKGVMICGADHHKYKLISQAIMRSVVEQGIVQDFVQYSVDEFFGTLPLDDPAEVRFYTAKVRDMIQSVHRIPVGCGCSQTNTLSKVATHFAKHYKGYGGICVLTPEKREKALSMLAVGEVWGVGRQNRKHLESKGIRTALDLANMRQDEVERLLNTAGVRTWMELNGRQAVTLGSHERQKSIMQSHTFVEMITDKERLKSEVAVFATSCAATLRKQESLCNAVTLFIRTNRYRDDLSQYGNQATCRLQRPTADTTVIIKAATTLLDKIFRQGYQYKQAGVVLGGIVADEGHQLDLFSADEDERRRKLMNMVDEINGRYGRGSITFARGQ